MEIAHYHLVRLFVTEMGGLNTLKLKCERRPCSQNVAHFKFGMPEENRGIDMY